jgi:hypothetical protein
VAESALLLDWAAVCKLPVFAPDKTRGLQILQQIGVYRVYTMERILDTRLYLFIGKRTQDIFSV